MGFWSNFVHSPDGLFYCVPVLCLLMCLFFVFFFFDFGKVTVVSSVIWSFPNFFFSCWFSLCAVSVWLFLVYNFCVWYFFCGCAIVFLVCLFVFSFCLFVIFCLLVPM